MVAISTTIGCSSRRQDTTAGFERQDHQDLAGRMRTYRYASPAAIGRRERCRTRWREREKGVREAVDVRDQEREGEDKGGQIGGK